MGRARLGAAVLGVLAALLVGDVAGAQYPITGATDCVDTFDGDGDRTTIFSPGGSIQIRGVSGCARANEQDIEGILESTPVLLARFDARGNGSYVSDVVTIPRATSSGRHNVVVRTLDNQYVQPITVTGRGGVTPRGLPRTGSDIMLLSLFGVALVGVGGVMISATWRRWRTAKATKRIADEGRGLEVIGSDEAQLGAGSRT